MASNQPSPLGKRQAETALRRGAKTALVSGGIQPATRRGNKELDLALRRLAQQPYATLEEATQAGAALGQKIVELSQARGKTDLDGGIVRQMMLTGTIPTVAKVAAKSEKSAQVVMPAAAKPAPAAVAEKAVVEAIAETEAEAVEAAAEAEVLAAAETVDEVMAAIDDSALADDAAVETVPSGEEAAETVDADLDNAPDLAAIETLEPEAIAPPEPEPAVAGDVEAAELAEAEAIAPQK